jgi:hypothetical protein
MVLIWAFFYEEVRMKNKKRAIKERAEIEDEPPCEFKNSCVAYGLPCTVVSAQICGEFLHRTNADSLVKRA